MALDLSHPKASVNWAISNLDDFKKRLEDWIKLNINMVRRDVDPDGTDFLLVAIRNSQLPLEFSVEAGAYINAFRSALDILATSLLNYDCITDVTDTYFPICKSSNTFGKEGTKGSNLINGVSAQCRNILESVQPYNRPDDLLLPLHNMDVERKHKRLLSVEFITPKLGVVGRETRDNFIPNPSGFQRSDNETILGKIAKSEQNPQFHLACNIAFDECFFPRGTRVIEQLRTFGAYVHSVINEFAVL